MESHVITAAQSKAPATHDFHRMYSMSVIFPEKGASPTKLEHQLVSVVTAWYASASEGRRPHR
eukprot:1093059-Prymnesium_polylepis.2